MATKRHLISIWLRDNWRSLAFATYFLICITDFIIMPIVYAALGSQDIATLVQLSLQYKDPTVQIEFLKLYGAKIWVPMTMMGSGSFHLAYGSLLTAAGWTRGQEKIAQLQQNNQSDPRCHQSLNQPIK